MLISPPRLNIRQGENESTEEWLNKFMPSTARGGFPIGAYGQWHPGLHLTGIVGRSGTGEIDICAIADGIVMVSQNSGDIQPDINEEAPAGAVYRRVDSRGVVVLRHETEIGEGPDAKIVYYSVYHHLGIISEKAKKLGSQIYRKELIGYPGRVGGQPGIHMEIFCSEKNLKKIIGRASDELDYKNKNGRKNIVYGDVHFYIPATIKSYSFQNDIPPLNKATPSSGGEVIGVDLFLTMQFKKGQVELHSRIKSGDEYLKVEPLNNKKKSMSAHGNSMAHYAFSYHDYEYDMYLLARELQKLHSTNSCSSIYELLKFGRVINSENEADLSVDVPHWHLVTLPNKSQKWINLHHLDIKVFSDGDFPPWMGWKFIDGSKDETSQCTNKTILNVLNDGKGELSMEKIAGRLGDDFVKHKFSKMICKLRSEWNDKTIMKMESWRTKKSNLNPQPIPESEYNGNFKSDAVKLCFWQDLLNRNNSIIPSGCLCGHKINPEEVISKKYKGSDGNLNAAGKKLAANIDIENGEIDRSVRAYEPLLEDNLYYFNPAAFIEHFSKNMWFSNHELAQAIPRIYYSYNGDSEGKGAVNYSTALFRAAHVLNKKNAFNKMVRKYGFSEKIRLTHLLSQELTEMFMASTVEEIGGGHQQSRNGVLFWPQPAMEYYQAFYGRGHMQLTWPDNYAKYGDYRSKRVLPDNTVGNYVDTRITMSSTHYWVNPKDEEKATKKKAIPKQWYPRYDPAKLVDDAYSSADSGGWYWISKIVSSHSGEINISRHADLSLDSSSVGSVSVFVNGGGNGYFDRQGFSIYVKNFFLDEKLNEKSIKKDIARPTKKGQITKSVSVDFTPQRKK